MERSRAASRAGKAGGKVLLVSRGDIEFTLIEGIGFAQKDCALYAQQALVAFGSAEECKRIASLVDGAGPARVIGADRRWRRFCSSTDFPRSLPGYWDSLRD